MRQWWRGALALVGILGLGCGTGQTPPKTPEKPQITQDVRVGKLPDAAVRVFPKVRDTVPQISALAAAGYLVTGDVAGNMSLWVRGTTGRHPMWRMARRTKMHSKRISKIVATDEWWASIGMDERTRNGYVKDNLDNHSDFWAMRSEEARDIVAYDRDNLFVYHRPLHPTPHQDLVLTEINVRQSRTVDHRLGIECDEVYKSNPGELTCVRRLPTERPMSLKPGIRFRFLSHSLPRAIHFHTRHQLVIHPDGKIRVELWPGAPAWPSSVNVGDSATDRSLWSAELDFKGEPYFQAIAVTENHIWSSTSSGEFTRWYARDNRTPGEDLVTLGDSITSLATTSDYRHVIAGLQDGRIAVYDADSGVRTDTLIPMDYDDWAAVRSNGEFEGTPRALSNLFATLPDGSRAPLDQFTVPDDFAQKHLARRADNTLLVEATIVSPGGLPNVSLVEIDSKTKNRRVIGPVTSVTPRKDSPTTYEIRFVFDDGNVGRESTNPLKTMLEVRLPGRQEPISLHLTAPPNPLGNPSKWNVLLVANQSYRNNVPPALGANEDQKRIANALRQDWSLGLLEEIHPENDLAGTTLQQKVQSFFENASEGQHLLFHFAGHGYTHGGEGYLLPTDFRPGHAEDLEKALSGTELWKSMRVALDKKHVDRIVVILDACRSGAFVLPNAIGKPAEMTRVAFLSASAAGRDAMSTERGGIFTTAFVEALSHPDSIHDGLGGVSVYSAFAHAAQRATPQLPHVFGGEDALELLLARPDYIKTGDAIRLGATVENAIPSDATFEVKLERLHHRGMAVKGERLSTDDGRSVVNVKIAVTDDIVLTSVRLELRKGTAADSDLADIPKNIKLARKNDGIYEFQTEPLPKSTASRLYGLITAVRDCTGVPEPCKQPSPFPFEITREQVALLSSPKR